MKSLISLTTLKLRGNATFFVFVRGHNVLQLFEFTLQTLMLKSA